MSTSSVMDLIHNPFLAIKAVVIYSASVLESATDTSRLLFKEIVAPQNIKTLPDIEREVSSSPPPPNPNPTNQ